MLNKTIGYPNTSCVTNGAGAASRQNWNARRAMEISSPRHGVRLGNIVPTPDTRDARGNRDHIG
eukprot:10431105-Lingulodinium_polyedra.AAC.1